MNPYITNLETKIIKRKYINEKTHLVAKNNILLDYENLNVDPEEISINGVKVDEVYNSSLGPAMVSDVKLKNDTLSLSVDYETRLNILKSLTARILINHVLVQYFSLNATKFHTGLKESSFEINGIYFEEEAEKLKYQLETSIHEYIKYDLTVKKTDEISNISGLIEFTNLPTSLNSIGEIKSFSIERFEFFNNCIKIIYSVE